MSLQGSDPCKYWHRSDLCKFYFGVLYYSRNLR